MMSMRLPLNISKAASRLSVSASYRSTRRSATPHASFRRFLSNEGKKEPSGSSMIYQAATLIIVGGTFYGVTNYLNGPSFREGMEGDEMKALGPDPPQAQVTSRAFFDVSIDGRPAGRIVLGLFGNVVPKTVKNFETLCLGTEQVGRLRLTYQDSTFHR